MANRSTADCLLPEVKYNHLFYSEGLQVVLQWSTPAYRTEVQPFILRRRTFDCFTVKYSWLFYTEVKYNHLFYTEGQLIVLQWSTANCFTPHWSTTIYCTANDSWLFHSEVQLITVHRTEVQPFILHRRTVDCFIMKYSWLFIPNWSTTIYFTVNDSWLFYSE